MAEPEDKFLDAEQQGAFNLEGVTFKDIVLAHLRRITSLASVEMRGGYWESRSRPAGSVMMSEQVYIQDSREAYNNAIDCLSDLCLPYFDSEMQAAEDRCTEKMEKLKEQFSKDAEQKKNEQIYYSRKLGIKRELFRALSCFLYRKNYFSSEFIED